MDGKKGRAWIWILVAVIITGLSVAGYLWLSHKKLEMETLSVEKLTVAAAEYLIGTPVYIAEEEGYFERNSLEVTIKGFKSGKAAGDALIAGEADISTSAGNVFVRNSFEHADLRVLGTIATAQVKELVARKDRGIRAINDLRGKKLGVTRKSGAEYQLGVFLTFNNLTYEDIDVVDLRPPEIVKAISKGDIDAAFTWDPYSYRIKEELGDNAIIWPGGEEFYFVLLTKEDWIRENPEAAERFMNAMVEAKDYINDNPLKSKEFVKRRFGYDSAYMDYTWPRQEFVVGLPQSILAFFDSQARWTIRNNLTRKTKIPNYLEYIYADALEKVKPDAVTIIH